jgi:predicted acylesterase/phospholipase RssA
MNSESVTSVDASVNTSAYADPQRLCDLVMQGGITSGVVYPSAITELAKTFRFSSIGGTSAGAIAAAVAAAGEYARASGGFERLEQIPKTLGTQLFGLFQPAPALKAVFKIGLAIKASKTTLGKILGVMSAALAGYPWHAVIGALPGIALATVGVDRLDVGLALLGLLIGILGLLAGVSLGLKRALTIQLPANGFGLCSGMTQPGYGTPALTNWLADIIDSVAGRPVGSHDAPLTFGDLKNRGAAPPISLAMMTTNLMMGRPHRLPMEERTFLFKKDELRQLVPARVFDHIMRCAAIPEHIDAPPDTYFHLPSADEFPVVLAARMSLSFPVLISPIPLYALDYTLQESERHTPRLCLFSDGGLSSNFPIHFFDRLWPNSPTFGITLEDFDPNRNSASNPVWMPKTAHSGIALPIRAIDGGLIGLLMRMILTAKDWQNNLQSTLPGYRERIVHIPLKADEGGLNLGMTTKSIDALIHYGTVAGELAAKQFDFQDHRWRRFLVAMARVEQTLDELEHAYATTPPHDASFGTFLSTYAASPASYKQDPPHVAALLERAKELVALGQTWRNLPTVRDGHIPKPETDLRITPKP